MFDNFEYPELTEDQERLLDEWDIEKEKVEQCIYEIGAVHAMMNKYDIDPKVLPFEALVCQLRSCFVGFCDLYDVEKSEDKLSNLNNLEDMFRKGTSKELDHDTLNIFLETAIKSMIDLHESYTDSYEFFLDYILGPNDDAHHVCDLPFFGLAK